jgi:hypothetical protein
MAEVCNISTSYFFVSMPQTNVIIFHRWNAGPRQGLRTANSR